MGKLIENIVVGSIEQKTVSSISFSLLQIDDQVGDQETRKSLNIYKVSELKGLLREYVSFHGMLLPKTMICSFIVEKAIISSRRLTSKEMYIGFMDENETDKRIWVLVDNKFVKTPVVFKNFQVNQDGTILVQQVLNHPWHEVITMSRTTQFIGLNYAAKEFMNDPNNPIEELVSEKSTTGMFGENIPLKTFLKNGIKYQEIVCADPWSSGPMIFTCLKNTKTGENLFEWISDYTTRGEFDSKKGTYWV